ncbi:MAG TPA: sialate O-acetylesterase [Opitutaceae bacterium]|nr:sialate O-acetylesterase [Opitutaceae bacterium]
MTRAGALLAGFALAASVAFAESSPPSDMKLFLLIGQSNMAGRGPVEPQDKVPHPRVFLLTKDLAWAPAVDPLHWDKPDVAGVGLGSSFGRVVAEADPKATIGLIPAAVGGTSLDQWKVGGELYRNAVARAREAMKRGKLAGILWHQGESDAAPEQTASYAERFRVMIAQLRTDLGAENVPVIVGELGLFRPAGDPMNLVLVQLPARVPRCAFVSAAGLTDKGDKLHFDSPSLREFGRRYAQAWFELEKPGGTR